MRRPSAAVAELVAGAYNLCIFSPDVCVSVFLYGATVLILFLSVCAMQERVARLERRDEARVASDDGAEGEHHGTTSKEQC